MGVVRPQFLPVTPAEPTSQPDRLTMSAQKMLTVLLFFVFLSSLSFSAEASAIHEEKRFDYDYYNPYAIQYKRSFDDYSMQKKSFDDDYLLQQKYFRIRKPYL